MCTVNGMTFRAPSCIYGKLLNSWNKVLVHKIMKASSASQGMLPLFMDPEGSLPH